MARQTTHLHYWSLGVRLETLKIAPRIGSSTGVRSHGPGAAEKKKRKKQNFGVIFLRGTAQHLLICTNPLLLLALGSSKPLLHRDAAKIATVDKTVAMTRLTIHPSKPNVSMSVPMPTPDSAEARYPTDVIIPAAEATMGVGRSHGIVYAKRV
jgi:hypothetical protein